MTFFPQSRNTPEAAGHFPFPRFVFLLAAVCLFFLEACSFRSPDTTYYVLQSPAPSEIPQQTGTGIPLQLRHVALPAYLDRNAVVTRQAGSVCLTVPQFHAWGEPLDAGIQRVLNESIAPRLNKSAFYLSIGEDPQTDWSISVSILMLEGEMGGQARLEARYQLENEQDGIVRAQTFVAESPAGKTYESMVRAESALVSRMGEDIANTVTGLHVGK